MPNSRPRSLLPKLALLLISLGAIFALVEAGSRVVWQSQMQLLDGLAQKLETQDEKLEGKWGTLPKLKGLDLGRPNLRGTTAGKLFVTNSDGFRGPVRPFSRPENVFRVAVIGDSFAMGFGVLYEETYAARLEDWLNRQRPDREVRRYEVLNFGLSGLEARAIVERFEDLALPFGPDLVVYGYTLNDIEAPSYRPSFEGANRSQSRFFYSRLHMVKVLGPRFSSLYDLILSPRGSYAFELRDNYTDNPAAFRYMTEGLERLATTARKRKICSVMLLHTRLESLNFLHPYHDYYDLVSDAAEAQGIHVARSYERFAGKRAESLWITNFDAHPNPEGHRLLGNALVDKLKTLPATCWRRSGLAAR